MFEKTPKRSCLTLFAIVSCLVEGTFSLKEMSISVPAAALAGDTVTLACDYNLEEVALYSIKWYWNDEEFYRYVPKESPPFRAFTVTFADFNVDIERSGSTEVTLRNVSVEMTGDYKCEVSADAPLFHTDIKSSRMVVVDRPKSDVRLCTIEPPEPSTKVESGRKMLLACYVLWGAASHLPPNITWFLNDEQIPQDRPTTRILPTETTFDRGAQQKTTESRLEFVPSKSHFVRGSLKIECRASLYSVWSDVAEKILKEEIPPPLAPVLGSASSQSHTDQVEIISSASSTRRRVGAFYTFLLVLEMMLMR